MALDNFDLAQFLNQQYLCQSLTMKEVEKLLDYTEQVECQLNDIIAGAGTVGDALYFVIRGEAALFFQDGEAGREIEVGRMKEGELMGEMSFFDKRPRMVSMRSMSNDTHLLKLTRAKYDRLRVENPYIAVNLLEHAIVSLDHLIRRLSTDVATFNQYYWTPGRK